MPEERAGARTPLYECAWMNSALYILNSPVVTNYGEWRFEVPLSAREKGERGTSEIAALLCDTLADCAAGNIANDNRRQET